ncbi:YcnI family copper-binding membrane protein [Paenibacillus abyssi]|uniref:YncI copper-binding domain-containing protein n=1 Tax=Paenibacillus abyssi TaxID=1340531 RepID=A0A917CVD7_9BACL|nr:YcnI family protein [Paenibacillus abyssi]GGF99545.1 hypothetical protein GCM10010916_16040 [Paenibacillus abyssi]
MKKWVSFAITAMALFLFAGVAAAHVTVQPKEVTQGTYEVFTVRVPSETKGTSTIKVEVKVPDGVNISRIEPKPGWTNTLERAADDRIIGVAWSAEGDGLAETEFSEFKMQGKVADDAAALEWKAYQTYADGSTVDWVGDEASITQVLAGTPGEDGHGHGVDAAAGHAADTDTAAGADTTAAAGEQAATQEAAAANPLSTWLSIAALALSLIALIIALSRKRTR